MASTSGRSSPTLPLAGGRMSRVTEDVERGVWKIVHHVQTEDGTEYLGLTAWGHVFHLGRRRTLDSDRTGRAAFVAGEHRSRKNTPVYEVFLEPTPAPFESFGGPPALADVVHIDVLDEIDAEDIAALGALPVIELTYEISDEVDITAVDDRQLFCPPPDHLDREPREERGERAHGS